MDTLQVLFAKIRNDAPQQIWSRGVELARGNTVTEVEPGDAEVELRVKAAGDDTPSTVTLYLSDQEWECDCESTSDVCTHTAAAIIALRQARTEGRELPPSHEPGQCLRYRLSRDSGRLRLERFIIDHEGALVPFTESCEDLQRRRDSHLTVEPQPAELEVDRFLQLRRLRSFSGEVFQSLLPLLARVDQLDLEGEQVVASGEAVLPRATVEDRPGGFSLRIEASEEVDAVLIPGIARCHGTPPVLRPLGETTLTGDKLERVPNVRVFGRQDVAELVGDVLPDLRRRIPVDIRTSTLPPVRRDLSPRIVLEVSQQENSLSVLPTLVYGDPPTARIEGERIIHLGGPLPIRNHRAEAEQAGQLREDLDMAVGRRVDAVGENALVLARTLDAYDGAIQGNAHARLYLNRALTPRVTISGLRLDVSFDIDNDEKEPLHASPDAVLRAWEQGEGTVRLIEGGWANLPLDWLNRFGPQISDLLLARKTDGTIPPPSQPTLAALCGELDHPRPPALRHLAPLLDGMDAIPRCEPPPDLGTTLRDYQQHGVDWLSFLKTAKLGAVLADDMGLGKTIQALCVMEGRCLVICPTSVMHNWVAELQRFRPDLTFGSYHGARRTLDASWNVTITSYAVLRLDVDTLCSIDWDVLAMDETQAIKNPDSQTAQAAFRIRATFRLALSGTPVENRLEELWSQLHFTNPGFLGGRTQFRQRYAEPIAAGDQAVARRLRQRLRPFVLRRSKSEVATELPPRTEAILHCVLDEDERRLYDSILLATRRHVVEQLAEGKGVLSALEALLRLRQVACHRALIEQSPQGSPTPASSSKLQCLMQSLEQAVESGHKALVFSQWTSFLDLVEPHLRDSAIAFERLDGKTRNRSAVVDRFQDANGPPLMLLSLKAGGVGLNLTAADHVFLLDPWWNPAVEAQAADRAHRIGQDKPVMVYRLVARNTVEERIMELQQRKRALATAALSEHAGAGGITRDDLLALLQ